MKLIIINGLPATGKTHLAQILSQHLDIPVMSKDAIKEFLFDELGIKDREWSKALGGRCNDFLYAIADAALSTGQSIIIENAFEIQFSKPKITKLIEKFDPQVYEIYCYTEPATRRKRFIKRNEDGERHAGHFDADNYMNNEDDEPTEKYAAIGLGNVITIDTTHFETLDIEEIVKSLN